MTKFKLQRYIDDFKAVYGDTPTGIWLSTDEFVDLARDLDTTPFMSRNGCFYKVDDVKIFDSDANSASINGVTWYDLPEAYLMNGYLPYYNAIKLEKDSGSSRLCTCDSYDLFHFGCKCGGR